MTLFLRSTYLSAGLSLLYIFLLYRSHPFRRLPAVTTLVAFAGGVFAVVPVIAIRQIVSFPPIEASVGALVAAAALEEVAKLLVAWGTIWRLRFPNVAEPLDVAIYFGVLGVGFGIYEDFWYIFSTTYASWIEGDLGRFAEVFRGIVAARALPGHILFNAIAGFLFGFAAASTGTRRILWGLAGFGVALGLHAGFNGLAVAGEPILLLTYLVLLVGVFLGLRRMASARSPFQALILHIERGDAWTRSRSPVQYLLAEGFGWPGRPRGGLFQFFPVVLSLCVLFPLVIIGVYLLNRALVSLL